jgi:hypothetical protein
MTGEGDASTGTEEQELSGLELAEFRNKLYFSEKSTAYGCSFKPRKSDVFVVTYPKCGTTWVTQICHQLRKPGHMDFGEITEVIPWDIQALTCGQDLDANQVADPRVFKSHECAGDIAKGGKYIHVCRDPRDVLVSFWRFLPAAVAVPPGDISIEEFADKVFGGISLDGGVWDFFTDWWQWKDEPNVLWVCFEDLKSDLKAQIRRIAKFMEIPLTEDLLSAVEEKSSFAFMEAHSQKFDDNFVFSKVRDQMGVPKEYVFGEVPVSKVRAGGGTVGEGKMIPEAVLEKLTNRWEISVQKKLGFESYADMRAAVLGHNFRAQSKVADS